MIDKLPLAAAFVAGFAIELINFFITRAVLRKDKNLFVVFPLRTLVAAAFIAAIYFTAKALATDVNACMIAGAAGATVGLLLFTGLLMNDNKKGGDDNG